LYSKTKIEAFNQVGSIDSEDRIKIEVADFPYWMDHLAMLKIAKAEALVE